MFDLIRQRLISTYHCLGSLLSYNSYLVLTIRLQLHSITICTFIPNNIGFLFNTDTFKKMESPRNFSRNTVGNNATVLLGNVTVSASKFSTLPAIRHQARVDGILYILD